ncbi:MAG: hypothetical protein WC655_09655, partial [Candidatus Hydrogenedentales bacterium]
GYVDAYNLLKGWQSQGFLVEHPCRFDRLAMQNPPPTSLSDHWFAKFMSFEDKQDGTDLEDVNAFYMPISFPDYGTPILCDSLDSTVWGYVIAIAASTPEREEAAWEFAKWVVSSDVLAQVVANAEYPMMPASKLLFRHPSVVSAANANPLREQIAAEKERYLALPLTPQLSQLKRILDKHFRRAWRGDTSIADALIVAQQETNAGIDAARSHSSSK